MCILTEYRTKQMSESNVVLRVTFRPESASDFLFEEDVKAGRLVQERNDYSLEEAYDFIQTFHTSLSDALVLVDRKKVVALSDFTYDI